MCGQWQALYTFNGSLAPEAIRPNCNSTDLTLECGKIIGDRLLSSQTPELPRFDRAAALEAKFTFPKTKKAPSKGLRIRGD